MADEIASLLVRVTADGKQAVGVLNGISTTVTTLANKNASLMNKISATGQLTGKVGSTITKTFGVATVAGLVASAKAAGQLNKELANIGTLSVPTERLKQYKGEIQNIAIATAKSTSDIAEGTYQVVSAFGDAPDTMEKVEINAKAATAGLATTADSIALTSAVTKAYGDTSAAATRHVADLAFKTVELGQTTFPELAQSMQQVTSLSKELGVSQEELFGAYATLTGVTGNAAEVQTQMKAVYTALLKPSENMTKAIQKQGYASGYSMIKSLGFAGTLDALKKATNGSEEQMLGLFNNVRAMPAVMALTGAQADVFSEKLGKMENASGAATKAFEVQTEGIAKTGFTLEQAKVKMQVAAQNFGESAAPIIGDFADVVDNAATKLSTMSDEERKAIINTGMLVTKVGVGLSVGGKALTIGTKLVGTVKAIGPAIAAGITNPVGIAALAIAGLGVTAKVANDSWYDSHYRWSKGLSEGNAKIKESLDKYKNLSDIQGQIKSLKLTIENPESSKKQVDDAKSKLEEIKTLLEKEYHLVIKSDNSNLDDAVENARQISKNELQTDINNQMTKLVNLREKDKNYENDLSKEQAKYDEALNLATKLSDAEKRLSDISADLPAKSSKEYFQASQEKYLSAKAIYEEIVGEEYAGSGTSDSFDDVYNAVKTQKRAAEKQREAADQNIKNLNGSHAEKQAVSEELANWETEMIRIAAVSKDGEGITRALQDMKSFIEAGELDLEGYAQAAALAMNGVDSLETAWSQAANGDGTALNGIVKDYIRSMQEFGATSQETASGAALIQNGFRKIGEAAQAGKLDAVVNDFVAKGRELGISSESIAGQASALKNGFNSIREAADAGKLDVVTQQANELARSMGLIDENKHITLSASGDVSIIDDASGKIQEIQQADGTVVRVSAEGDVEMLDKAGNQTAYLESVGAVELKVNAAGDIEALDNAGNVVANLSKQGEENNIEIDANTDPAKTKVDALDAAIKDLSQTVEIAIKPTVIGGITGIASVFKRAKGDTNFRGGLAMVNDDGRADPRELIIDNDRAFIPEGRDVILPLSRGAKVYTSSQTKAIMSGLGIPHYASGKNNSDAFTSARDDWTHYTKIHTVTTAQELEKWLAFQERYKENEKDIWDIEEQVFSLQKKLYSERVSESENWLKHEEKYNGMSVGDYLAGIDRMKAYTAEYYAQGIINHKEYTEAIADLDEKYLDKRKEQLSELYDNSSAYISEHTYFNDWQDIGDDPLAAYNRVMERNREALAKGELTQKEYNEYAKNLGSDMYSERKDQSLSWLEEQRKYFGMSDDEYVEGLERIKAYTQKYYNNGLISRTEYNKAMTELDHSMWDEALSAYDDMLQKKQDYISEMREQFQKEEQALQDSWAVADRKTDMSQVQAQLDIYKNAVTDRGQEKYKELQEQMKQLQRDEELYNLQVRNNATIEGLEADYKTLEENKKNILNDLRAADIDISGYVENLSKNISLSSGNIESLLSQMLTAFKGFKVDAPSTTYADNRVVNLSAMPLSELAKFMGGMG